MLEKLSAASANDISAVEWMTETVNSDSCPLLLLALSGHLVWARFCSDAKDGTQELVKATKVLHKDSETAIMTFLGQARGCLRTIPPEEFEVLRRHVANYCETLVSCAADDLSFINFVKVYGLWLARSIGVFVEGPL